MAPVVDHSCVQQFQHFITNSPCHHEPVVAQIGQDADRLLGGKPTSCPIMQKAVLRVVRNLAAVNLVRLPVAVTSATASPRRTETSAQFCTPASSLGTDSPVSQGDSVLKGLEKSRLAARPTPDSRCCANRVEGFAYVVGCL
jgi:hypothetical protein